MQKSSRKLHHAVNQFIILPVLSRSPMSSTHHYAKISPPKELLRNKVLLVFGILPQMPFPVHDPESIQVPQNHQQNLNPPDYFPASDSL